MADQFDLTGYLAKGIEQLIADIMRSTLSNPREAAFFVRYRGENARNEKLRQSYEAKGRPIPPFLIASITSDCNLHCTGCYARANGLCQDAPKPQLGALKWRQIFRQAADIGVSFVLLAGGEPLLRRDVIETAAEIKSIIFPIFTNGTMLNDAYLDLFDKHRNLVPILSMEGSASRTDERRGAGTSAGLDSAMAKFKKRGILFGASLTVTTANVGELTGKPFLDSIQRQGCRLAFYVSYVPVQSDTQALAPDEHARIELERKLDSLRALYPSMIFLSFPGDERNLGGCLAAGRGFFHINAKGDAEACPFSPYSDRSLVTHSLLDVLASPFFARLKEDRLVGGEHDGACVLFEHEEQVKRLLL
jgi:MoaA/NifB/PqqE/SkfB family radical SAM enzyme